MKFKKIVGFRRNSSTAHTDIYYHLRSSLKRAKFFEFVYVSNMSFELLNVPVNQSKCYFVYILKIIRAFVEKYDKLCSRARRVLVSFLCFWMLRWRNSFSNWIKDIRKTGKSHVCNIDNFKRGSFTCKGAKRTRKLLHSSSLNANGNNF